MRPIVVGVFLVALFAGRAAAEAGIAVTPWGSHDGMPVQLYTLTNARGMEVRITNYGGIVTSIRVPDRNGVFADVVEGYDSLADYTSKGYNGRYGSIIGRYSNRIKSNTYQIDGVTYHVTRDGKPYDERVWSAHPRDGAEPQLFLTLTDPDGSMGFPGTVHVAVTYTLARNDVLRIDYRATTDKDTIVNLTNHSYFNLAGGGSVLDELLLMNADAMTPSDEQNVPTGEVRPVAGTPFDFRKPIPIGRHIDDPDIMLERAHGYDHNFVINGTPGRLRLSARLEDPKSSRVLEEWTTQPGVQVYSANYEPPPVGKAKGYTTHSAVALEAEHAPNSPNIVSFTSPVVTPQKPLHEVTEFRFSVDRKTPEPGGAAP